MRRGDAEVGALSYLMDSNATAYNKDLEVKLPTSTCLKNNTIK